MELLQLWDELSSLAHTGIIGLMIILAGMIKIPKMELNIWNTLGRIIGRSINGEMMKQVSDMNLKVNNIQGEVQTIQKEAELERVRQARQRILRFNDEILFDKRHSKEHFDEILSDIDIYEDYCRTHEDYENNKAILAIATIREVYKDCLKTHDFLVHTKKVS